MYNPAEVETFDNDEYEFIELKNIGFVPLQLGGIKLTDGISYVFDETDGLGFSLTIKDAANPDLDSWDSIDAWHPSAEADGSPGFYDTESISDVL